MDKKEKYIELVKQVDSLTDGVDNPVAVMANTSAAIASAFGFWWTGFYTVGNDGKMHLGPFQGPVACYTIPFGKGVCGTAWERGETVVVPDVEQFPGHIACSSVSRSEIVVPIFRDDKVIAVLDIDSKDLATFDETDRLYLEQLCKIISSRI
ncbi:MAG: GAF domain-containing protein [Bacteroidales bacterium]|nr:GAF domain-containing protein [Bacteroidales bacterium]